MTATERSPAWIENAAPRGRWRPLRVGEPWRQRELLWFFAVRDIKVRYKQALLGIGWAGLQPLLGALAFTVLFHELANIELADDVSYFAFALVGYFAWSYFSGAVSHGTTSLLDHSDLVTKVAFPRIVAPLATLVPGFIDIVVGAGMALAVAVVSGATLTPGGLLLLVPGTVLLVAATAGPTLVLSAVVIRYRDVKVLVTFALQLLLFASPVGYPPELVPGVWRTVLYVNPVSGALGLLRAALIGAPAPTAGQLALSAGVALVVLVAGLAYFRRREHEFADIV